MVLLFPLGLIKTPFFCISMVLLFLVNEVFNGTFVPPFFNILEPKGFYLGLV